MGIRRKAREAALQLLYAWDLSQGISPHHFEVASQEARLPLSGADEVEARRQDLNHFCKKLIDGVLAHREVLDEVIQATATHWRLSRMDAVDRNLLRMGAFEILHCPDIPKQVTLNESIELAKKFSTKESSGFINGILDHIAKEKAS
ncbi:MAG: transcription antitermination factor NusB [Deltaproteobacteria bacterium]|nr:transcription antitermination factor NusB [Deltaproteobacteria bacterium]